ncbi:hypothetical protein WJX73_006807 [Symbiochloris irregularis]|uniref:Uncharacterized protein n=1 Tax=Symbiochloris irregularis TaxID=706552 RepID=A0AAW1NK92_9CHLO
MQRFEFSEWHYASPSGVFNPAAVFSPEHGWVMVFRWDRCHYDHCGVLHSQTTALVSLAGKEPSGPDMEQASENASEWRFSRATLQPLLTRNTANAAIIADLRPFNFKGDVFIAHWMKFGWEGNIVPPQQHLQGCWVEYRGKFSCDYTGISRLNFDTRQLDVVHQFRQPLIGPTDKHQGVRDWAFIERGKNLFIIYSLLPCTAIFLYNPKTSKGATFHSGFCYQQHSEIKNATGLVLQDAHFSGNPTRWTPPNSTTQSEFIAMVHAHTNTSTYAHWAVRLDSDTLAVTHISSQPLIKAADYEKAGYKPDNLVVGSCHELILPSGKQVLRLLLGQGLSRGHKDGHLDAQKENRAILASLHASFGRSTNKSS